MIGAARVESEMMRTIFVWFLWLVASVGHAEPAQIDKSAVVASVLASSSVRDGVWLRWACEAYQSLYKEPGAIWKKTDTKNENLGAGLCAGFISGVSQASGVMTCASGQAVLPGVVLEYLHQHADRIGQPAVQLVLEALKAQGTCP